MLFWFAIWLILLAIIGAVAKARHRKAEYENATRSVQSKIAEIERLKKAEAAGEDVHKPRRKSRRMKNRRR